MKVLYSWLKDYVDIPWAPDELAEKLTMAGLEVEEVKKWQPLNDKIIVGKITSVKRHPNSDHLVVCQTDTGDRQISIVCGAPNTAPGLLVPVALPGAVLPRLHDPVQGTTIRGAVSEGIICSEWELGISDDHSGIMVLSGGRKVGSVYQNSDQKEDAVIDISVTPNRGDCLSMIGIAREIAALSGSQIRLPEITISEEEETTASNVSVELIDSKGCPRYSARIIRGITVGESPSWMKDRLEACGIRSINNIVDITNYVLLEVGQPLHAFDFDYIKSRRITVRSAKSGESFITLDGISRTLNKKNLLICDGECPVALAGVMGGVNSEVIPETRDVLLESAFFDPKRIRQSSSSVGLNSEASHRFERGIDTERVVWASNRASALMRKIAGGKLLKGIVDKNVLPERDNKVVFRPKRCIQVLGADIQKSEMVSILKRLECRVKEGETFEVTVPSHRWDLFREIDLIEEVARICGFHRFPANTRSTIAADRVEGKRRETAVDYLKNVMVGMGLYEVITNNMGARFFKNFLPENEEIIPLANPLNEEMAYLRPSLIPSLIDVLEWNKNRDIDNVRIFEIGKVFSIVSSGYTERLKMSGLVTGESAPRHWSRSRVLVEFYDFKGIIETILLKIFLDSFEIFCYDKTGLEQAYSIVANDNAIGYFGKLPGTYRDIAGSDPVYVFEFQLDTILDHILGREPKYSPISRFPVVKRDLVLMLDREIPAGELIDEIRKKAGSLLKDLKLFDLYEGKQIPKGKKSLGFSLSFGSDEKTLPEAEVNAVIDRILDYTAKKFEAVLRPL